MQAACADATRAIEWLGADEPFKLEWSDGVRKRSSSTWLAPTIFGSAEYHWLTFWSATRRKSKDLVDERLPEPVSTQLRRARARVRRVKSVSTLKHRKSSGVGRTMGKL